MHIFAKALVVLFTVSIVALTPASADARSRDTAQTWHCVFQVGTPQFAARLRSPDGSLLGPRIWAHAYVQCERKTWFELAVLRLYRVRPDGKDEVVAVDRRPELGATEAWVWDLDIATPCREGWHNDDPPLYARAVFTKRGESERVFVTSPVWDSERDRTCPDHGPSATLFGPADGLPASTVDQVAVASDGTVWAGGAAWLARFDGRWTAFTEFDGLDIAFLGGFAVGPTGGRPPTRRAAGPHC